MKALLDLNLFNQIHTLKFLKLFYKPIHTRWEYHQKLFLSQHQTRPSQHLQIKKPFLFNQHQRALVCFMLENPIWIIPLLHYTTMWEVFGISFYSYFELSKDLFCKKISVFQSRFTRIDCFKGQVFLKESSLNILRNYCYWFNLSNIFQFIQRYSLQIYFDSHSHLSVLFKKTLSFLNLVATESFKPSLI